MSITAITNYYYYYYYYYYIYTKSDRARKTPGNPDILCGARDVTTIHEILDSLIRFSLQNR